MKKYKRICAVDAIYPLFLYLLLCKDNEEIENDTFYVFGSHIPESIIKKFKHSYQFKASKWYTVHWAIYWVVLRFIKFFLLPSLSKGGELYANDHLEWSSILIGYTQYILLEDGPTVCDRYYHGPKKKELEQLRRHSLYRLKKLLYGPTLFKRNGHNYYCKSIVMAQPSYVEYVKDKKQIVLSLTTNLWNSFNELKKKIVLDKFNLTLSEVEALKQFEIILLTRPLWPDTLSRKEHQTIYKQIISNYDWKRMLVKPHPRDNYSYENDFPGIYVFHKPVPMQLIDMLGCQFKVAISTFSTAVSQFDYPLTIMWYGTEIHPSLVNVHGHVEPPKNAVIKSLSL